MRNRLLCEAYQLSKKIPRLGKFFDMQTPEKGWSQRQFLRVGGCRRSWAEWRPLYQAHLVGIMDKRIGTLESVFIACFRRRAFDRGDHPDPARRAFWLPGAAVPWYAYTSGILGLVIVGTLAYSAPRPGSGRRVTVFVAAQFLMGAGRSFGWMGGEVRPLNLRGWPGWGCYWPGHG